MSVSLKLKERKKMERDWKMMRKQSEKMKKPGEAKRLISVSLMGSCGPIRLFVSQNQKVSSVVEIAVTMLAEEGRVQVVGSKPDQFLLYCLTESGWEVLEPSEAIIGPEKDRRNFRLFKKPSSSPTTAAATDNCSRASNWTSWIRNTLHLNLSSSHSS